MLDSLALDLRTTDELDVTLGKPHYQLADGLQGFGLMRFKDNAYPLDWRHGGEA